MAYKETNEWDFRFSEGHMTVSMSISCHLDEMDLQMVFVVCDDASQSGVREDDAIKDCMCLLQS